MLGLVVASLILIIWIFSIWMFYLWRWSSFISLDRSEKSWQIHWVETRTIYSFIKEPSLKTEVIPPTHGLRWFLFSALFCILCARNNSIFNNATASQLSIRRRLIEQIPDSVSCLSSSVFEGRLVIVFFSFWELIYNSFTCILAFLYMFPFLILLWLFGTCFAASQKLLGALAFLFFSPFMLYFAYKQKKTKKSNRQYGFFFFFF